MVMATTFPVDPDGIPVRGGAGAMTTPSGVAYGRDIACGGANAMPMPNTLP